MATIPLGVHLTVSSSGLGSIDDLANRLSRISKIQVRQEIGKMSDVGSEFDRVARNLDAVSLSSLKLREQLKDVGATGTVTTGQIRNMLTEVEKLKEPFIGVAPEIMDVSPEKAEGLREYYRSLVALEDALKEVEPGVQLLEEEVSLLNDAYKGLADSGKKVNDTSEEQTGILGRLRDRLRDMNDSTKSSNNGFSQMYEGFQMLRSSGAAFTATMTMLNGEFIRTGYSLMLMGRTVRSASTALAYFATTIGVVIGKLIFMGKEAETLNLKFKYLTGNIEEGSIAFEYAHRMALQYGRGIEDVSTSITSLYDSQLMIPEMVDAALNLSAATGKTMPEAVDILSSAVGEGEANLDALRDAGIKVSDSLFDASSRLRTAQNIAEAVNKKYAGAADKYARTAVGAFRRIGVGFSTMARILTEPIWKSFISPALTQVGNLVASFAKLARGFWQAQETQEYWANTIAIARGVITEYRKELQWLGDILRTVVYKGFQLVIVAVRTAVYVFDLMLAYVRGLRLAFEWLARVFKPLFDLLRLLALYLKSLPWQRVLQEIKEWTTSVDSVLFSMLIGLAALLSGGFKMLIALILWFVGHAVIALLPLKEEIRDALHEAFDLGLLTYVILHWMFGMPAIFAFGLGFLAQPIGKALGVDLRQMILDNLEYAFGAVVFLKATTMAIGGVKLMMLGLVTALITGLIRVFEIAFGPKFIANALKIIEHAIIYIGFAIQTMILAVTAPILLLSMEIAKGIVEAVNAIIRAHNRLRERLGFDPWPEMDVDIRPFETLKGALEGLAESEKKYRTERVPWMKEQVEELEEDVSVFEVLVDRLNESLPDLGIWREDLLIEGAEDGTGNIFDLWKDLPEQSEELSKQLEDAGLEGVGAYERGVNTGIDTNDPMIPVTTNFDQGVVEIVDKFSKGGYSSIDEFSAGMSTARMNNLNPEVTTTQNYMDESFTTGLPGDLWGMEFTRHLAAGINNEDVLEMLKEAIDVIYAQFHIVIGLTLVGDAYQWGKNIGQHLADGLRSQADEVCSAAQELARCIDSNLGAHSPPPEGPLSDMDTWGGNIIDLIVGGMLDREGRLQNTVTGLASVIGGMQGAAVQGGRLGAGGSGGMGAGMVINIYVTDNTVMRPEDADQLADTIGRRIMDRLSSYSSVLVR